MKYIKRFLNWLFGKHWGYTPKEVAELTQDEFAKKYVPHYEDEPEPHTEQSF